MKDRLNGMRVFAQVVEAKSFSAAATPTCGFPWSSASMTSIFFPRTPPFALISLTASSAPCLHVIPRSEARPDSGSIPPSLIVSAADAAVANTNSAASANAVFLIPFPLPRSIWWYEPSPLPAGEGR